MQVLATSGEQHLLNQFVRFSRTLHEAGIPVNSSNLIDLCECMSYIDIGQRQDFYAAARATLLSNQNDIELFDLIFASFWNSPEIDQEEPGEDSRSQSNEDDEQDTENEETLAVSSEDPDESEQNDTEESELSYSKDEVLMKKDFESMDTKEIEQARRLIAELVAILANYKSRRRVVSHKGTELNLRKMLRHNALYGKDSVELMFRKQRIKKTKLMLLCDVSGSMERYSRFLIQFIYALRQQLASLELAVFSTRMTVITEQLRHKSVDDSLKRVADSVHDWAGGTNIGGCLREFNDRFAHDMNHSHTVMIILSDGWDRGDPCLMREEMQHLHRRVHKLIWLNPLLGSDNYQPLCKGIQTALPYIDHFLPAHNLESFASLVRHLRTAWH